MPPGAPQQGKDLAAPAKSSVPDLLTPAMRERVLERRARNALLGQIRANTWGKDLSAGQVHAIAEWSRRHGVDPVTEVEVLGGRLYLNANYYGRKLSVLIAKGKVEWIRATWIHIDQRLDALAATGDEWAMEELTRRLRSRIEHRVPDECDAAMVFEVKHVAMSEPVRGVKFHDRGSNRKDPVGDSFPTETIETRAMRRAMLFLQRIDPEADIAPSDVPVLEQPDPEPERPRMNATATMDAYVGPSKGAVRDERLIAAAADTAEPSREPGEEDEDLEDERWIEDQDRARGPNV